MSKKSLIVDISSFHLWPHQVDGIDNTFEDWASDCPDALVCYPTGCGKTRFFCAVAALVWEPGKRILVLAHTEELVDQPRAVFEQFFCPQHPDAHLGTVRAQQREYKADIIFATVQTLSQDGYKPLIELLKHGQIDILIVDETHHITAETYLGLKERLKTMAGWKRGIDQLEAVRTWLYETFPEEMDAAGNDDERKQAVLMHKEKLERKQARWGWMANHHFERTKVNPNLLTLGVTATPYRTDNISLGNCFPRVMERDRFTYCLTIRQAIALKLLATIRPSELQTKIEANDKLVDLWAAGDWADLLINHWLEVCGEKHLPTLAFMPDIMTSKSLIKHLGEKHNIVGGHVDGEVCYLWNNEAKELEKVDRKTLLEKFKAREFCFLSNYGVLTEGVDFPFLEVEIIARPTQSRTAYVQMLGRVLRLDQDNPDKIANIIHVGFQGMALVDYTSVTGEMLSEEMEAIEKAFAMLTVEGHAASAPPCPSCQGPLKRIRGTRDYQCELCLNMFTGGKDVDDHIPDILDPTKPSGKGAYAKYISLFVEDVVAWYREDGFYSVSIGVGGRNGDEAERTLLIAPPGVIPRRPDGHSLIEVRRPVLGKNIRGTSRFNQYVQHELGPREGCFIGNPADLETILEIAQERIGLYKEPGLSDKDRKWRHDKLPQDGKLAAQLRRFGVNTNVTKGDASRIYAHKEAMTYMRRKGIVD